MTFRFILAQPLKNSKLNCCDIKAKNYESAVEYVGKNYKDCQYFSVDNDVEKLISYLKLHISYLSPSSEYNNWNCLINFLRKDNNLILILNDYVSSSNNPSKLFEWIKILEKYNFDYSFINDRIEKIKQESQFLISDMTEIIRKDALKSLQKDPSFRSREGVLTAVSLNPEIYSTIILELGQKYDLGKLITVNNIEQEIYKLKIHEILLTLLQANGFPKIGLLKQELLDINNKNKWSLNSIEKIITNISIEDFAEALIGYNHIIKVNELLTEENKRKKSKIIHECLLQKNDFNKYQKSQEKLHEEQNKSKISLDEWQKEMINHIQNKHSLLVKGPTSGGKTYASMAAIDWLINTDGKIKLLYCAPTDHLCMQTWANISKTFERQKVALICGILAEIPENANIWIGTPIELYTFLRNNDLKFQIAIFDEIHTISTSFSESTINRIRSEAMAKLLGYVTEQIIAISATIHDEDIPILKNFIISQSHLEPIYEVVYTERPVPIFRNIWDGKDIVKINDNIIINPVTADKTFDLILKIKDKKIYPALIFDENEENCYNNFSYLVDWLDNEEKSKSKSWSKLNITFKNDISSLNSELSDLSEELASKNDSSKNSLKPRIKSLLNKKITLMEKIRHTILQTMKECQNDDINHNIKLSDNEIKKLKNIGIENITPLVWYLSLQLVNYQTDRIYEDNPDCLSSIIHVCQGVMPFYRIGNHHIEAEAFRSLQTSDKLRSQMLQLCKAERIRENEIKPLFDLIIRGLEYGIGIILPTMPFVVQYEMLKLINSRKIEIVFASESMSMGINFPIPTVVIRSEYGREHNVCELMQMEGRAGRRRLDDKGYVIFWNILNANTASLETLPRINLPNTDINSGALILNPIECAIDIECQRVNITDTSLIDEALGILSSDIDKELAKIKTKKKNDLSIDDFDDRIDYSENNESPIIPTNKIETIQKSNINDQELAVTIIGCIGPVMKTYMNMSSIETILVTYRIQQITIGSITEDIKDESYKWAQIINNVKKALQEIHTHIRLLPNVKLTKYIASIYEVLHRIQYRQMRI